MSLRARETRELDGDPRLAGSARVARYIDFRSGAVIAVTRLVLAAVFFLALWVDPGQPVRATAVGYGLLLGYLVLAVGLVVVARTSWWWDHRLAVPVLAIDIAVFLAAVFFTEGSSDFTSPFLAFFAYLMLAATIRWDWRTTATVGLIATTLYLVVGLAMAAEGIQFDGYRFLRRTIYMLILSVVLVWLGLQRRERQVDRFDGDRAGPSDTIAMLDAAMAYGLAKCGGSAAAIAWNEGEEPATELRAAGLDAPTARLGPGEYDPAAQAAEPVRLFDRRRARQLRWRRDGRPRAVARVAEEPLARLFEIDCALALPLAGSSGRGELLLVGIAGPTSDHVEIGERIAREIADAFDRQAATALVRSAAVAHTRDAVARDLHDSVAQALAGASFRLEALRTWIRAGNDPEPEIATIKAALRTEQQHVRGLISRLRAGGEPGGELNLSAALSGLARDLSRQWGIEVVALASAAPVAVPRWLAHEVHQIVREAVANGVRHGRAGRMALGVGLSADGIVIEIADDGNGFPVDKAGIKPWSLFGRVKSLGGTLGLTSGAGGTRIEIVLPLEEQR